MSAEPYWRQLSYYEAAQKHSKISLINIDILTDPTRERVRIPLLWNGREYEFVLDHLRHYIHSQHSLISHS
jgi:hypothetical protein